LAEKMSDFFFQLKNEYYFGFFISKKKIILFDR
jgi:hypothetical protein